MFDTQWHELGKIPVGQPITFYYKYLGIGDIVKIDGRDHTKFHCSCTSSEYNYKTKILKVTYTPKAVPLHITNKGENLYKYDANSIMQFKENGTVKQYVLQFTAFPYDADNKL